MILFRRGIISMAHHLVERRKELKRRRKRRCERLKEKKAALSKAGTTMPRAMLKGWDTASPSITKPIATPAAPGWHASKVDLQKAQSVENFVQLLPADIKPRKIWTTIPEELKEEIIRRARDLAASRHFAAPAEWDGSLKQALLLMSSGRLPNGFKIFLGL